MLRNISWYISFVLLVLLLLSSAMTVLPERERIRASIMLVEGVCSAVFLGIGLYFMWLFRRHPSARVFHMTWLRYGYLAFAVLLTGLVLLGGIA
jgi:hypothetical protein